MRGIRSGAAFLAAAISCALGVASIVTPDRSLPRTPRWRYVVAPLAAAPLPHGTLVGLIGEAGADPSFCRFLLLEAAWRRPDVWWTPLPDFPLDSRCTAVVVTDARPAPPGWATTWSSGGVRLLQRTSP